MSTGNGGPVVRGAALSELPALATTPRTAHQLGPDDVRFIPSRRRRDWRWIIGGLGLMCLAGISGWVVVSQYAAKYQVLVAARVVPAGHVFTLADLRTTDASAGGLGLLQEADESQVIGHTAAVAIPAGAPLVPGDVGSPAPGSGVATLAVLCKPGQFPPSLAPGDHVSVLTSQSAAGAGASPDPFSPSRVQAVVLAVDSGNDAANGSTVITLQVDAASAAPLAQASIDGRVSLAITGSGS